MESKHSPLSVSDSDEEIKIFVPYISSASDISQVTQAILKNIKNSLPEGDRRKINIVTLSTNISHNAKEQLFHYFKDNNPNYTEDKNNSVSYLQYTNEDKNKITIGYKDLNLAIDYSQLPRGETIQKIEVPLSDPIEVREKLKNDVRIKMSNLKSQAYEKMKQIFNEQMSSIIEDKINSGYYVLYIDGAGADGAGDVKATTTVNNPNWCFSAEDVFSSRLFSKVIYDKYKADKRFIFIAYCDCGGCALSKLDEESLESKEAYVKRVRESKEALENKTDLISAGLKELRCANLRQRMIDVPNTTVFQNKLSELIVDWKDNLLKMEPPKKDLARKGSHEQNKKDLSEDLLNRNITQLTQRLQITLQDLLNRHDGSLLDFLSDEKTLKFVEKFNIKDLNILINLRDMDIDGVIEMLETIKKAGQLSDEQMSDIVSSFAHQEQINNLKEVMNSDSYRKFHFIHQIIDEAERRVYYPEIRNTQIRGIVTNLDAKNTRTIQ